MSTERQVERFVEGHQYKVKHHDGSWVTGTITQMRKAKTRENSIVTVEFDRVYPKTSFILGALENDIASLVETGEFHWCSETLIQQNAATSASSSRKTLIRLGRNKRKNSDEFSTGETVGSPSQKARQSPPADTEGVQRITEQNLEAAPALQRQQERSSPTFVTPLARQPSAEIARSPAGLQSPSVPKKPVESALETGLSPPMPSRSLSTKLKGDRPGLTIKIAASSLFEAPTSVPKTPVSVKSERATPLHRAVLAGNVEEVKVCLKQSGFPILNRQDESGYTAIMSSVALANSSVGLEITKLLLADGADLSLQDHEGFTAFHWCVAVGNDNISMFLFEHGVDVNVRASRKEGDTPLHRACRVARASTIALLVDQFGADVHAKNNNYEEPFDVCGIMFGKRHVGNRRIARRTLTSTTRGQSLKTLVLHHPDCDLHETPDGHFEGRDRIPAILQHLKEDKTFESPLCIMSTDFPKLERERLLLAHSRKYVDVVYSLHQSVMQSGTSMPFTPRVQESVSHSPSIKGWSDTSFSPGSLSAALRAAGGACHAVSKVMAGDYRNAVVLTRPPGHHAGRNGLEEESKSCGFCIFNNVAIAALFALKQNLAKRVAIVDFDVHHGQGTEEIIEHANRPQDLLFVSSHLYQKTQGYEFYPGTGKEMGKLEHNVINVPLAPLWAKPDTPTPSISSTRSGATTRDSHKMSPKKDLLTASIKPLVSRGGVSLCCGMGRQTWRAQMQDRVLPALRAFNPDLIILSAGFDAGKHDVGNMNLQTHCPKIGMDLSNDDYVWVTDKINSVARMCCGSKVVSVLEGGYGQWKSKQGIDVIDRTLLAGNCTAHVRAMVGNYMDD